MAGQTLSVPLAFTVPTPWSMLTLAAPVDVQASVLAAPATIDAGFAVTVAVGSGGGGGGGAITVTVTLAVMDPETFVAVTV